MESQKKACQHRDGYHDGPQHATIGRGADNVCLRDLRLRVDSCDIASHISPMEYCPVKKQTDHGDGTEVGEKVAIGDAGHGANQHILRIAGNGRHATDVGSGSKRQQVKRGRSPIRLQMPRTSGAMNKQTTSFTRNAERIPLVKITPGSNWRGARWSMTRLPTQSKKPARCRLATISIIAKSRTRVPKSTLSIAVCGVRMRNTNIRTAPTTAMAGRSIFVPGRRPNAKTK